MNPIDQPNTGPFVPGTPLAATAAGPQPGDPIGAYKLLQLLGQGGMGEVWMADQSRPIRRLVAIKLIQEGRDSKQVLAPLRSGTASAGDDGSCEHRESARRRQHRIRPTVLRHGIGQGDADHGVLRQRASDAAATDRVVHSGLPGRAARASKGDHPSRFEAVEHSGWTLRRQARAEGDRLRRCQGPSPATNRPHDVHRSRFDHRHAGVHGPRTSGIEQPRHRHACRRLCARRGALRTACRIARRSRRWSCAARRTTKCCG